MENKEIIIQKINDCQSASELTKILAENNIDISTEKIVNQLSGMQELNDDDLDKVTGGFDIFGLFWGQFSPFLKKCATEAIGEAKRSILTNDKGR